ncbi:beta-ketoacyl-[acyl-carrier-protein] synthase family protein [Ulvibacter litoralis]|uniref:3-oxoacyl-[acyl-carrier-protein] synthase-1 n=1 Tax=Ulvibacter litoralis TaxID=227084 RepID=A0A1G7DT10_9FLAO|nr:beta-ketoacyl synthase N-terminal-like domain-containing protein [Ulvibacter litoralis]GHC42414.1 beta-ketoacyl synthase [Ulvibacter litoralis]SDE54627.1 3-oxoacyl-[acyl-carrier-protein] synthase-1 [Ulvibacter litoralis]
MRKVYVSYNSIVSALGFDSKAVVENIANEVSGIRKISDPKLFPTPFYASLVASEAISEAFHQFGATEAYTRLEQLLILSLQHVIEASKLPLNDRVGLIISTTKGNIDVLEKDSPFPEKRAYLAALGNVLKNFFGFQNDAIVLSNACVSGVLAVAVAKRYIQQGTYDHVFIASGDIVSQFILSGFNSFQAMSSLPCKPYSNDRTGITIGELSASALVTSEEKNLAPEAVEILGEASCNDANHISGPSRTGEGLYRSIQSAMKEAAIEASTIDYISAHGTATSFNDEMEAIAFNRAALQNVPLNSLKGYFGHTLGASGLVETIVGMHSLHQNTLFTSLGFSELGVSKPLTIITEVAPKEVSVFLKTASGFGGCNTAAIFQKCHNTETNNQTN